jgi:hypothetical protein
MSLESPSGWHVGSTCRRSRWRHYPGKQKPAKMAHGVRQVTWSAPALVQASMTRVTKRAPTYESHSNAAVRGAHCDTRRVVDGGDNSSHFHGICRGHSRSWRQLIRHRASNDDIIPRSLSSLFQTCKVAQQHMLLTTRDRMTTVVKVRPAPRTN